MPTTTAPAPEIWKDTEGKVTHYVCCAGTGGSLSGTARYLKEVNPDVKVIGVDAYGSVLKKYWQNGCFSTPRKSSAGRWKGWGKTIIPDNMAFDLIDEFIKIGGPGRRPSGYASWPAGKDCY